MAYALIDKFTNWILYTSLFAASCAVSLCMATERLLVDTLPAVFTPLHVLVFCSTLLVYNAHYLVKKSTPELSDRFGWSQHYRLWHYLFLGIGGAGCLYAAFHLPSSILYACGLLALLSFAYSLPLLPFNKKRLKDLGLLKILVLTTVWTIVTSVLPILYWGKLLSLFPFEILIRFVFLLVLCIAFDIRDMQTDLESGIITLPNMVGIKTSYSLMDAALLIFVVLSTVQYIRYPSLQRLSAEIATAIVTAYVLRYTKKQPSDKAYLGLVDGMMLLYALLILL